MSSTENFFSRWSRLKSEPEVAPRAVETSGVEAPPAIGGDEGAPRETLVESQPVDEPDPAFDPASLPPIESIEIGTDIRGFLQPHVPPELTRAALRRAWARDPSIRDFVDIAENQWNFNDPSSIFGFGPMRATDNLPALLAQALGRPEDIAERVIAASDSAPEANPVEGSAVRRESPPVAEAATNTEADESPCVVALEDSQVSVGEGTSRRRRQQGGALPR